MGPGWKKTGTRNTLISGAHISHGERVLTALCNSFHFKCLAPTQNGTHLFSITIHEVRLSTAVMTVKQGLCLFNGCGCSLAQYQA